MSSKPWSFSATGSIPLSLLPSKLPLAGSLSHRLLFDYLLENNYSSGVGSGGQVAKDALGNDVIAVEWLKNHGLGDRTFTQGLKEALRVSMTSPGFIYEPYAPREKVPFFWR